MATTVTVSRTNNADIDGLLSGYKWSGAITYSFPDSPSDYANPYSGGDGEPTTSGFASAPSQMQAAINYAIGLILGYTNANIQYAGTNGADIMVAQSPSANPTSYAYYPGNYAAGGDVWFGTQYNYSLAKLGNYYFTTALHELGHAFGLKHSQETGGPANVAVPSAHDDSEYTVMSYRSYVGASTSTGYTNEAYGYPQTYMANDILALQTMYGANYTTQSGSTLYTWNPTTGQEFINGVGQLAPGGGVGGSSNRIYETVWDGGGVDTYDLSNYTTNLNINLNPGASSLFSTVQLANLGNGHYASGNVYNAYLSNNDARSYIDNATGGSGNDTIIGNVIANVLNGASGNDTITGGGGNDTIIGGSGTDTAVYSGSRANYGVTYNSSTQTFTLVDLRSGSPDGTDTVTGVENFQFADGTITGASLVALLNPTVIEASGSTSLVLAGSNYYLDSISTGTGPMLKYMGSAVTVGMWPSWSPIGAEQVSGGGYDVVWKNSSTGMFSFWSTDSNGNFVTHLAADADGSSTTVTSLESTLHQDLNGDGVIGAAASTTIEAAGSTSLVQTGSYFYLDSISTGTGPTLKYSGSAVTVGMWPSWSPIGAEQVSGGGYDVVWKNSSTGMFSFWSTDSNGNFVTHLAADADGSSTTVTSLETTFHQDLNGDGVIGAGASTTIEAAGSTSLIQTGSNFYLDSISTGTGPTLKYSGSAVTVGMWPSWSPIGAEQVSGGGYDVVWKNSSTGMFSFWSTDSNGNFVTHLAADADGSSTTVTSLETTFHQDLNGDGVIGAASSTTIEAAGSTVQVGSNNDYEFVWKNSSTGMFSLWSAKSDGNFALQLAPDAAGSSTTVTSLETIFQHFNSDGVIGNQALADTGLNALDPRIGALLDQSVLHEIHASNSPDLVFSGQHDAGFLLR
ncbi:M10 family metallopeptidase C-terminal domain-containing protein [Bradyrhizobium sp. 139]|uniref:M10 family metallopeptidase C-terminal domain-containing protein n=1 Tax=Bradyrhizobium sp. 139 TaxID=2782616 RepID=UPI001FF7DE8A|nr:M10 family metallopeptidase C-terminal domain-containing protein [Bradyrhizobium sp. 139]MCK1743550.1 M10 family metallopeptidase C-terminal domain-containing protein [Bradyrhizobium sp. 139]